MSIGKRAFPKADPDRPPTASDSYGIWCVVSGGITGHREAWLKQDGAVMVFPTEAAASVEAARLTAATAGHKSATFRYTAEVRN